LLTFVMLWAYLEFSQFLIIWGGSLTEEIPWYLRACRNLGGTRTVTGPANFALPFFCCVPCEAQERLIIAGHRTGSGDALSWICGWFAGLRGGNVHLTWMNILLPCSLEESGSLFWLAAAANADSAGS
jgi:hypothetical protein